MQLSSIIKTTTIQNNTNAITKIQQGFKGVCISCSMYDPILKLIPKDSKGNLFSQVFLVRQKKRKKKKKKRKMKRSKKQKTKNKPGYLSHNIISLFLLQKLTDRQPCYKRTSRQMKNKKQFDIKLSKNNSSELPN